MAHQELPDNGQLNPLYTSVFGPACSIGFGSVVFMWVVAWILHMPGVHVPTPVAIPLLLLPLLAMNLFWIPGVHPTKRLKAGAFSGLITGLVNLLILGSFIAHQPESTAEMPDTANTLGPNALVVVFGSIAVSVVVATIAALIVKNKQSPTRSVAQWLSRMAIVTALTFVPLIAVGGAVTSTDSGLAVPDAVTSYGAVSVLFPLKLMAEPHIFLEHSHRLFGTLAGLTTIVLMVRVLRSDAQKITKTLSVALFLAVSLQGYLGIIRVADQSTGFAVVHGVFAQLVLALAFVIGVMLSIPWRESMPSAEVAEQARKARTLISIALGALLIQLVFGALTRHMHSKHAMMSHMGFAFVVMTLIIIAGAMSIRAGKIDATGRRIKPFGIAMHAIVSWQFALGFVVLGLVWTDTSVKIPTSDELHTTKMDPQQALIATTHQLSGALLLAITACAFVWALRLARRPKMG